MTSAAFYAALAVCIQAKTIPSNDMAMNKRNNALSLYPFILPAPIKKGPSRVGMALGLGMTRQYSIQFLTTLTSCRI